LVSDIPAGDGKIGSLFVQCKTSGQGSRLERLYIQAHICVQSDLGGVAVLLLLEAVEVEVFRLFRFFSLQVITVSFSFYSISHTYNLFSVDSTVQ
jgi:hypothetical protein